MSRKIVSHGVALFTFGLCVLLFASAAQAALAEGTLPDDLATDTDGDGVPDIVDNCLEVPNAGGASCDSDQDGYGNACDGDFNNDGTSDGLDFASTHFLADFAEGAQSNNAAGDPQGTDMNCDGSVDGVDFSPPYFLAQFSKGSPGASGLACAGTVPCKDSLRISVGLAIPFTVEGELTSEERVAQKNAIQSAQESLLARLPAGSFSNPSLSTHIPFLGLEVDKDALAQLIEDPDVSSLRADQILQPTLDVSIPLIRADVANGLGCSGAGQAVVVLDTGADAGHSFFAGTNIAAEACFSTTNSSYGSTTVCPNGGSSQTGPGAGTNCNTSIYGCNHGTHVSGIAVGDDGNLFGVARDADLIPIQVFSRFGSYCSTLSPPLPNPCALPFTGDLRDGLNHVADLLDPFSPNFINQPIAAVNLSLGGGAFAGSCDTYDPGTTTAIDNLRSLGVATVVSSGNGFVKYGLAFPACITSAVSVGATDDFDNVPSFSQSASNLDLLAPGVAINSSVPGGGFQSFSGTSMAAPHVAGAWACHMSTEPSSDVTTVLDVLAGTGVPVIDPANAIETPRIDVRGACCMPISTANMVGWWTGDSGAPDDISGNGNHASWIGTGPPGTPISPSYSQPGMVDDAFSFTASNQVILRVPDDPTLNFGPNSFSVDAWVNLQGAAPLVTPRTIVKKQDALGDEGYWLFLTGNHICYGLRSNTGSDTSVCTISTIPTTGWHFLVWSVDRQTDDVRIYIDGSLALTINIASFLGSVDPADDLEIGTDFEGLIDEVEIFDYALGAGDVGRLFNAGSRGKCKIE